MGGPVDQPHPEVLLELPQRARQGGLPDVQAGRGARDVGFLGDREEAAQVTQLDGHVRQA